MVIVMDTGRRFEDEFGAFEEEVLNAQWLPNPLPQPALQLGMQELRELRSAAAPRPVPDVDAFLRTMYLVQE
jgi:hypothetical protein